MAEAPLSIVHVDTEATWRGGEQQVLHLVKGLADLGHKNIVVVKEASALQERLSEKGILTFPLPAHGELDIFSALKLRSYLLREQPNIVHAHSGHGVALASLATLGTTIPFVITRRVDFPLSQNVLSRLKWRRANTIIAISQAVKKVLVESGLPENKIPVVHSGVDFSVHKKITKASREEMGVPADSFVIGQVAALAPHKDQSTFLHAINLLKNKIKNVRGVMVGDGPLQEALQQQVRSMGLENEIRFLGFRNDPLRFLAAFDVFCLSSKTEGLGTSLLDAMALKIPIVATNAGGISELIRDNVTGYLVPVEDPSALADALFKAKERPSEGLRMAAIAYEKSKEFDVQNTIRRTVEVYRQLYPQSYPHY
jgi:L-malate glycosyltransferase